MGYVALAVGFILSVMTAWISFWDKKRDYDKNKNTSKSFLAIFTIALLGALVTLITNITSIRDKVESGQVAKKLNDSLLSTSNRLEAAQQLNLDLLLEQQKVSKHISVSQEEMIGMNRELSAANKKIIVLQDSVIENIMGAGNVPNFTITGPFTDRFYYTLLFSISNKGKTPLRSVVAYIEDSNSDTYYNRDKKTYDSPVFNDSVLLFERSFNYTKQIFIGDLSPHSGREFYRARVPKPLGLSDYFLRVHWDNGTYTFSFMAEYEAKTNRLKFKLFHVLGNRTKAPDSSLVRFDVFEFSK